MSVYYPQRTHRPPTTELCVSDPLEFSSKWKEKPAEWSAASGEPINHLRVKYVTEKAGLHRNTPPKHQDPAFFCLTNPLHDPTHKDAFIFLQRMCRFTPSLTLHSDKQDTGAAALAASAGRRLRKGLNLNRLDKVFQVNCSIITGSKKKTEKEEEEEVQEVEGGRGGRERGLTTISHYHNNNCSSSSSSYFHHKFIRKTFLHMHELRTLTSPEYGPWCLTWQLNSSRVKHGLMVHLKTARDFFFKEKKKRIQRLTLCWCCSSRRCAAPHWRTRSTRSQRSPQSKPNPCRRGEKCRRARELNTTQVGCANTNKNEPKSRKKSHRCFRAPKAELVRQQDQRK